MRGGIDIGVSEAFEALLGTMEEYANEEGDLTVKRTLQNVQNSIENEQESCFSDEELAHAVSETKSKVDMDCTTYTSSGNVLSMCY